MFENINGDKSIFLFCTKLVQNFPFILISTLGFRLENYFLLGNSRP